MGFTAEEQLVLSQLAYKKIEVNPDDVPQSLESILEQNEAYLRGALGEEYYDIIEGLKQTAAQNDCQIIYGVNDDPDSGFVAIAIEDNSGDVTVVCQGSEDLTKVFSNENSRKDADTDLQIALRKETDQQQELEKFMDLLMDRGHDSFYFAGHSLGGNLAIHGAVYVGDPDKVKGVATYNAPGFNAKYYDIHAMRINQIEGKIVNFENEFDIVSSLFNKPGTTVYVESNIGAYGLNHSLGEIRISNGGFATTPLKGVRDLLVHVAAYLLVDIGWHGSILASYLYSKITGGTITGYRDFSQSALKTMTDAAREVEEEAWWRVDRWDCWYRMDKAFGGFVMDYQRLTGNVDTYYRKLIDMNDASVSDIEAIFEKVYGLDDTYAAKIRSGTEQLSSQVLRRLNELAESITPGVG